MSHVFEAEIYLESCLGLQAILRLLDTTEQGIYSLSYSTLQHLIAPYSTIYLFSWNQLYLQPLCYNHSFYTIIVIYTTPIINKSSISTICALLLEAVRLDKSVKYCSLYLYPGIYVIYLFWKQSSFFIKTLPLFLVDPYMLWVYKS